MKIQTPKASVLVVDDTHDNLRLLTGILSKQGYLVRPVPDGALALVSAKTALPDIILLDIMMPGLSGYEVCEQLKADDLTRDIPVIFISALNEAFDKVKAFALGGVDFITKPFQVEEVAARVRTHLMLRNLHKELQEKNTQLQAEIGERIQAENSLKESLTQIERAKQEWESTADSLAYVVCLLDEHGRILRANRTVEHWHLGDVSQMKGQELHVMLHPNCQDPACYLSEFLSNAWAGVAHGQSAECEQRDPVLKRSLQVQLRPITSHRKAATTIAESFAVVCFHDISRRKQAEQIMRQRNCELAVLNQMNALLQECHTEAETYQVLVSGCKELFPEDAGMLYMMDENQSILHPVIIWGTEAMPEEQFTVQDCWCLSHNTSFLAAQPDEIALCNHPPQSPQHGFICVPVETSPQQPGVLRLWFTRRQPGYSDQDYRHQLELKRMMLLRLAEHYALSLTNLRLREALHRELLRDPLTGLYNRRYMEESLQREAYRTQRSGGKIAMLMLDIDHFKQFNDTYGHKAGDVILMELGAFLQSSIRGCDIACRYGGEEFLLILPDADADIAYKRAHELLLQVRKLTIPYQGMDFQITVSIGVAVLSTYPADISAALEAADQALYQAKEQGRNQIVMASPA